MALCRHILFRIVLVGLLLVVTPKVQGQDSYEPESPPSQKPRFDRFNRWMKVVQEFFTEGNWLSGGPDNLIEYITRTLGKLLDILLNRKQTPQIDVPTDMDIPNGDPMVNSARQTAMENEKMRNTLSDLLRMLPADRINLNDLNLNMNRQ